MEKPVIRTDNGTQFTSYTFQKSCENFEIKHERIPPRTPNMNAQIEGFHRILEDDCLKRFEFESYEEAYREVADFMKFYNERRIHSNILDLPPVAFYEKQKTGSVKIKDVRV